jgi:tetratricopeptide (TPR) repeat protein
MPKTLIVFCFTMFIVHLHGQLSVMDSLLFELKSAKNDTNKVNLLNELSYQSYRDGAFEAEMKYGKQALDLAKKLIWKKGMADAYRNIGGAYEDISDYQMAQKQYVLALKMYQELGDQFGESAIYNNIGEICRYLGNYPEALKNYFTALTIKEQIGDQSGLSTVYNNMGIVYERQGNYKEALKNHFASLEIELGDELLIASSYNNIALVYEKLGDYDACLDYNFKALALRETNANKLGMAHSYNNIGIIYYIKGIHDEALKYCQAALTISEDIGDKSGIISAYNNLGRIYIATGKASHGKVWLQKALTIAEELGYKELMKTSYSGLFMADSATRNYESALYNFQQYIAIRDSLINEEKTKLSVQLQMQYEFDKKEALAKAEQDKKDALAAEQNKKQELQKNVLLSGILVLLVIVAIVFRSYRNKRKANAIISRQKEEVEAQRMLAERQKLIVEEKNNEILDSITYAKNLQDAILPPLFLLEKRLPEMFVLYKPKDIIAGDFYWQESFTTKRKNHLVTNEYETQLDDEVALLAVADCTGHGVPGAMVSVVCSNALHRAHVEFGLTNPGEILDKARELVIQTFAKSQGNVQDGMDISLVALTAVEREKEKVRHSYRVLWSGANNPLWIIRVGATEIEEIKPDKQPVGKYDNPTPFTTHAVELFPGDIFYLFTDGYQDQFGGDKGKKFKASQLKELLISIQHHSMKEQQQFLAEILENWKGNLEQVDDVCIIGVRV